MTFTSRTKVLLTLFVLVSSLIHFVLGWILGLSGDEAHYAMYAAYPALSYYDHPPLVGWIQWPLVALQAPDGLLRLVPEALWAATAYLVFAVARRLQPVLAPEAVSADAAGLWALCAFSVSPVLHVLGIGLLPDTLLMMFTVAILLQTLRMSDAARAKSLHDWLLLGALLGLAGLSKYTAIFAALPVLIGLIAMHGWRVLRQAAPWLALLLALLLVAPVFVWNAQHDWMSFAYQLHHGKGSEWQASQLALFLGSQLLMYPLSVWGAVCLLRLRLSLGKTQKLPRHIIGLLSFFALPFTVLMYLSGGGSGLPHWTAPAWVALIPFAGVGLAALWSQGRRLVTGLLAVVQAVICALLFTLMYTAGPGNLSSGEQPETINPMSDFYGWDAVGQQAQRLAKEKQIEHLAVQNWTLASRLAWYARPLPVHVLDPAFDQFALWTGELPAGTDAILLDWSQMAYKLPVGEGQFQSCDPVSNLPVVRADRIVSRFTLYLCRGWGGKPKARRWDEP